MARRKYRIVHESYLAEWLGINYPAGTWRTNVRLGDIQIPPGEKLTPEEERMLKGAFGAIADAIVLLPDKVIIVEAMVRHDPGSGEDLLKYEILFRETKEFKEHWNKPIEKIIVTPLEIGPYIRFYEKMGVRVIKYTPLWIQEYLGTYPPRHRRGKLSGLKRPR